MQKAGHTRMQEAGSTRMQEDAHVRALLHRNQDLEAELHQRRSYAERRVVELEQKSDETERAYQHRLRRLEKDHHQRAMDYVR